MSKTAITIDRTKETITLSRSFQIAAGNIASDEYREYLRLKEQYPGFSIIVQQKQRKKAEGIFSDLSYEGMKEFIEGYEATKADYEAAVAELDDLRDLYKGQRGAYLKIKAWFLDRYQAEVKRIHDEKEKAEREKREANYLYHPKTTIY